MSSRDHTIGHDRLTATWIELAIRLGVLGLLLYLAFILLRPFITIAIWSVVLQSRSIRHTAAWWAGLAGGVDWPPPCSPSSTS